MGYLDEAFTAPPQITQLLVNKHNVDKVLVGGEAVHNSLERKDLLEYLSIHRSGKQGSCFFYNYKGTTFKWTSQVSRYTGLIGTTTDEITQAKVLKPGECRKKVLLIFFIFKYGILTSFDSATGNRC